MNPWANLLLFLCAFPEVWLLWKVANFWVNLHDKRYTRDVKKVLGERPARRTRTSV